MHWTQRPENRERMLAVVNKAAATRLSPKKKSKTSSKKKKTTRHHKNPDEFRRRIALGLKRHFAEKRAAAAAAANGHEPPLNGHALETPLEPLALVASGRTLARTSVRMLAVDGAKLRLAKLDREREVLLVFIRDGEK